MTNTIDNQDYNYLCDNQFDKICNIELLFNILDDQNCNILFNQLYEHIIWKILKLEYKINITIINPKTLQKIISHEKYLSNILEFLLLNKENIYLGSTDFTFSIPLYDNRPTNFICLGDDNDNCYCPDPLWVVELELYDVIKYIYNSIPDRDKFNFAENVCICATINDKFNVLKWAYDNGFPLTAKVFANSKNYKILQWLYDINCPIDTGVCNNLVHDFALLKWARTKGFPWDYKTLEGILSYDTEPYNMFKWAYNEGCPFTVDVCDTACFLGKYDIIQWLYQYEFNKILNPKLWIYATEHKNFGILKWLHSVNCPKKESQYNPTIVAARINDLDLLKWLYGIDFKCDSLTFSEAAKYGNIEILEWLHDIKCDMNAIACWYASINKNYNVVKWLRKIGCTWDKFTCLAAMENNDLEFLIWAVENGCPCSLTDCLRFAKHNQEIINWAHTYFK